MCQIETKCAECESIEDFVLPRRAFMRAVGGGAALALGGGSLTSVLADDAAQPRTPKPAEALIKELHASLSAEQQQQLVLPWDHMSDGILSRHGMYNRPFNAQRIGDNYTKAQQELIDRILRSICSGEDGYETITRRGSFDTSGSLEGCGSHIFGDPSGDGQYAWLFAGHHLTVRCDGNSEPNAAFGGPVYYGHSVPGYSDNNVYIFQTRRVQTVFDALDADQQQRAVAEGSPGERRPSIQFREEGFPGIGYDELSGDQQELVAAVMRDVLSPFRSEDADEVMEIVKANGGMEQMHLAFYKDEDSEAEVRWHFWRLEGPGFVWNFRVLPHVHCYVNIANVA
jgi:Protein of unknown function (DUF3500)